MPRREEGALPDVDGAAFLVRVRTDTRTAPVLALTATAGASSGLDDGVLTRILAKPFDLTRLRNLISARAGSQDESTGQQP